MRKGSVTVCSVQVQLLLSRCLIRNEWPTQSYVATASLPAGKKAEFFDFTVELHVNDKARWHTAQALLEQPDTPDIRIASSAKGGLKSECWVLIDVKEAYIH